MKLQLSFIVVAGFLISLGLTSCGKDDASPCNCVPLAFTRDPLDGYNQEEVHPLYGRPSFNPKGHGEFVYYKGNGYTDAARLNGIWRAELGSRLEQQLLPTTSFQLGMHWGAQGRIAFTNGAGQIATMLATGDSLQQITYGINHRQPVWSPDGRRLVCELDGERPQHYGLVVLDAKGHQLEKLPAKPYGYAQAWSPDATKLAVAYNPSNDVYGIGIYDFATQQLNMVAPDDKGNGGIYGAAWLPDSRTLIWASGSGLFKTDTETRQTVRLRRGCNSRTYLCPTVSPDGQTILVQRNDVSIINDDTTVRTGSNLWTMNIDGSNERKVVF